MLAGTGIVEHSFKSEVKQVIADDCEYYSYVTNRNYTGNRSKTVNREQYIEELNVINDLSKRYING